MLNLAGSAPFLRRLWHYLIWPARRSIHSTHAGSRKSDNPVVPNAPTRAIRRGDSRKGAVLYFFGCMGDPTSRGKAREAVERFGQATDGAARPARVGGAGMEAAATAPENARFAGAFGAVSVAFVGRPTWATSGSGIPQVVDPAHLADRFESLGSRAIDDLRGAFAVALFDRRRRTGLIATDPLGIQPVFVLEDGASLLFACAPAELFALTDAQPRISAQAVFDYLYAHVVPAPRSIYENVRRLLPGECADFANGRMQLRRYWQPMFDEKSRAGFDTLREQFLSTLQSSVQTAMQGARCGAFLSGGTDSSTIAGMMARLGGDAPDTFSIGFSAAGFDEMEYARLASRHFKTRHHEYYVTPRDIVDAVPRIAEIHPQPFGNSSALPTYYCARLAREHGIERLLGGDGGDELFGGNARYARQYIFSLYERLPAPLRESLVGPACQALSRRGRIPVLGKAVSYVVQASVPMPDRLETYNLLHRIGIANVLAESALARIDVAEPSRQNSDAYFNPSAASLINRMLALDFKTTLADNDLPKVVQSCALAGLPVRFPMLDARVMDFSLALAPRMKLKGTRLRYFFKEALRDFLPEGLPFGQWAVEDPSLRQLTFDSLEALKRRDLVRPQFIDLLTSDLLQRHPDYYGTMAWVMMMLELWLQHHVDRAAQPNPILEPNAQSA
jgi:asparagine synthase (glutamine-hydrolysing)